MNEIVKLETPELQGIEKSKAEKIRKTFEPMTEMLGKFEDAYNEVVKEAEKEINQDVTQRAKRVRIDISKVRIETEKLRKSEKEEYLRAGKAIDGVSNILKWAVTDKEKKLKEIEDYFEIQEQKRLEALQNERAEKLSKYVEDAHERDLSGMDDDVWNAYFQTKKQAWEDEQEAIRKAEEERKERERLQKLHNDRKSSILNLWQFVEGAAKNQDFSELNESDWNYFVNDLKNKKAKYDKEQERIRKENERLQKEAEERERKAKAEAEKRAKEEAERKEKERKERAAYEAKLRKEREERERLEKAEQQRKAEEEARKQAELNKGDADKVKDLIAGLDALKSKYTFKSKKNQAMYADVSQLIDKVIAHIEKT